ncbi:hypothetical protein [Planctomicrobium piriforme]|uniref:Dolichyl-phosphate-mannose-protein mannosyltransferase n=1 Tax=Planctomicrobium piriforme TaxID=1576369 RepID=A0A1I3LNS7_9PLAN|nr:hypothetical protein [Planctomicrobium piriforme]SFI86429.1 hypothetical protein SAMN05421753_11322 [Planctomicrobium piriforme]
MSNVAYFTDWINALGPAAQNVWRGAVVANAVVLSVLVALILRQKTTGNERWTRPELLLSAAGVIGILLVRIPCYATMGGSFDETLWLADAITLRADPRFWISVDATTSGPLTIYLLLLPELWGGVPSYGFARLLTAVIWGATASFFYAALRNLVDRKLAALAAASLFAVLAGFSVIDNVSWNGEHLPIFCMMTAMWLLSRQQVVGTISLLSCLTVGLLLGAVPFAKLQAGPMAMTLGLFSLFLVHRWSSRMALLLGALTPLALVAGYLITFQAVEQAWLLSISTNLGYARSYSSRTPIQRLLGLPAVLFDSMDTRVFFLIQILTGIAGLIALSEVGWKQLPQRRRRLAWLACSIAWLSSVWYAVSTTGTFFNHYFLFFLTPLLLWNALSWYAAFAVIQQGTLLKTPWRVRHIAYVTVALITAPLLPLLKYGNTQIPNDGQPLPLVWQSPLSDAIAKRASPDSLLAVWGHRPELYVQTGLPSATRYPYPYIVHAPWSNNAAHQRLYLQDLASHPNVIFVEALQGEGASAGCPPLASLPELQTYVDHHFQHVDTIDGSRVWQSNRP